MIPAIETGRLLLRPPRPEDAAAIALYLNDFAVAGNLARVPFPYRLSDARAWLRSQQREPEPQETGFAIELAGAGYVGHIGYQAGGAGPVIGYWLGRPFWGRGVMSEAAAAAIAGSFRPPGRRPYIRASSTSTPPRWRCRSGWALSRRDVRACSALRAAPRWSISTPN